MQDKNATVTTQEPNNQENQVEETREEEEEVREEHYEHEVDAAILGNMDGEDND
jgi:hypothetical protein